MTTPLFCLILAAVFSQASYVRASVLPKFDFLVRPHMIGGRDAKSAQIPYQARIDAVDSSYFCGGSLISDTWVLTAAHCLHGHNTFIVSLGVLDHTINEPGRKELTSRFAIVHELFDKNNLFHDIGLIKLPEPVPVSSKFPRIQIIPMAPFSYKSKNYTGMNARVSGWGQTSDNDDDYSRTLQYLDLTVISRQQCMETFSVVRETVICAVGHKFSGACYGDSGGPLVLRQNEIDVLIGVQSFVRPSGCEGGPAGFTNVAHYRNWIAEKTGILDTKKQD